MTRNNIALKNGKIVQLNLKPYTTFLNSLTQYESPEHAAMETTKIVSSVYDLISLHNKELALAVLKIILLHVKHTHVVNR